MSEVFNFYSPTRIILGQETITRLPYWVKELGGQALIVTESILRSEKIVDRVEEVLRKNGIQFLTYDDLGTKSTGTTTEKILAIARASKSKVIIGLGGINALATAKCVAALAPNDHLLDKYYQGMPSGLPHLHYIEVLTTCRSPFMLTSEIPLIDGRDRSTYIMKAEGFYADVALIDPCLAVTQSEKYSSTNILSTLLLAFEGYFCRSSNYIADTLFLKAVNGIISNLDDVMSNLEDSERRLRVAEAGLLVAFGLSMSSQGLGSAISYVLRGKYLVPKSWTASILLPYILEYGLEACPQKVARMAPILGEDTSGLNTLEAAERVVSIIRQKISKQQFPMRLGDFDLDLDKMIAVADQVSRFHLIPSLPSSVNIDDIYEIIKKAF